jgi:putative cell wall-binding protein
MRSLVICTLVAANLLSAGPAWAATTAVFAGLTRDEQRFTLADGQPVVVNVLSFADSDPLLRLRPVLGGGAVTGLEPVPEMGRRLLRDGAVAGVNGGFWLDRPAGDPNGFVADGGRLLSEPETQGGGPRGTVAVRAAGTLAFDRLAATVALSRPGGPTSSTAVTALNRYHRASPPYPDGERPVYVYTPEFAGQVTVEPLVGADGTPAPVLTLTVSGLRPPAAGAVTGLVAAPSAGPGPVTVPAGGSVVVAHGQSTPARADVAVGQTLRVDVSPQPLHGEAGDWSDVAAGLAAGPLILRDGRRTDPAGWFEEGFTPEIHSDVRHPRTAVARTAGGRVLLVTVDGRRPGYSVGMTLSELADFLLGLGAVDGLSLDGGGSTALVTDGAVRNQPCCEATPRPVATGLFVFHSYAFAASERLAGDGREATAAAVARALAPAGADEVVVAAAADYPDALAGGPLAAARGAPLLLAGRDGLSPATREALSALRPRRVTLLGGEAALGPGVAAELAGGGYAVECIGGDSRVATAAAVARTLTADPPGEVPRAFLAAGDGFADALAAAAPAGLLGMPILLSGRTALPEGTRRYLREGGVGEVVLLGGPTALGGQLEAELAGLGVTVSRLGGSTRYGTSQAVNAWAAQQLPGTDQTALVVAAGDRFADALAGGPLAAGRNQLLLLVPPGDVNADPATAAVLAERAAGALQRITLLGGVASLSSYQHWQLDQLAAR